MRLLLSIFCIGMAVSLSLYAQNKKNDTPKRAVKLFKKSGQKLLYNDYDGAKKLLLKTVKRYPEYIKAHAKLGELYWKLDEYGAAEKSYRNILKVDNSVRTQFMVNYALGKLLYEQQKYEAAITCFTQCLSLEVPEHWNAKKEKADWHLKNATFAQNAIKNPVPFNPILLDSCINTKHDEYLPMVTADEEILVFTRRFLGNNKPNEDFYYSGRHPEANWQLALDLGQPINTNDNEGAICISPDGTRLFFAAKGRKNTEGGFDIYYCIKQGNAWKGPFNIGRPVNSSTWDSQPSISADGKSLYFCSRRKGGYGGIDIWVSHLKNNFWSEPINLGPTINTPHDEQSPFIHADNQTLYFSSNGHVGMGDTDLYVVRKDTSGLWGIPENLGYPINTPGNENGLIVTASGERAYFSSFNEIDSTGLDLHYFDLPQQVKPNYVTYVKGSVFDEVTKLKIAANIELIDLETGEVIRRMRSDKINGEFLVTLPSGKNYMYNVSRQGYLFHSENFSLVKSTNKNNKPFLLDIALKPIVVAPPKHKPSEKATWNVGKTVVLKNVFFETGSYDLKKESEPELNRLVALLEDNPKLNIEISGHTDSIGSVSANQALSTSRAKAVYNYLLSKGISSLQLRYKGYGESKPIADNSTAKGRAINRRTEFTILQNSQTPEYEPEPKRPTTSIRLLGTGLKQ